MRSRIPLAVAALAAMLVAVPRVAAPAPVLVYSVKAVERHDPTCRLSRSDLFSCAHILFEYPVVERAPAPAAAAAINQAVRDFLVTSVGEPRKYASIEAAMQAFMQEYEEYKKQGNATRGYWEERRVAILYQSSAMISVQFDASFYLGGAHPQYAATFTSFDATTGTKIALDDVLVAGYRPRLTRIAETVFRAQAGIKPGTTLSDAGYVFFKNGRFALNDNFWFGPTGVTFFYNTYEIAPYAMGTTELLLTYRQIKELIKPDGPLRSMR